MSQKSSFSSMRQTMVKRQLLPAGIDDPCLLQAMSTIPREDFVLPELREVAYADTTLPLNEGQSLLSPTLLAACLQGLRLKSTDRVLLIGSGRGYSAVLISALVRHLDVFEYFPSLAKYTQEKVKDFFPHHVSVHQGDGLDPTVLTHLYDAIFLSGSLPAIPPHFEQALTHGGRLLAFTQRTARLYSRHRLQAWTFDTLFESEQASLILPSLQTHFSF
jgi:protein-L-isoaspartate(D-aspartate) O-methyltransferase